MPPAALPRLLIANDIGGGLINMIFDADILVDPLAVPDLGAFELNGNPVNVTTAAAFFGLRGLQVQQPIDPSAGQTASWGSQPPYLLSPIDLASSILIT